MRVLVIDDETVREAAKLVARALRQPTNVAALKAGNIRAVGYDPSHVVTIPMGYRCVFSFELQPEAGLCRLLSVSIDLPGKLPAPEAVDEIAALFGFDQVCTAAQPTKANACVWLEDIGPNHKAVNVVQPVVQ